jgi:beta propeller repeat protein
VGGTGVSAYRWTINNGYYRAETLVSAPLLLSNLSIGPQIVGALGKIGGIYQPTNIPTTVAWNVDPLYGYNLSSLSLVRSLSYTNIGNALISFNWDGRNGFGVIQPPGYYTVRFTLADSLGHTNFATALVQISPLTQTNFVLADFPRGPQKPSARGKWSVWQDQSDGNWQIYAQDLSSNNSPILKITTGTLSQQNPRTDGRYVVWQGRQANGNWDVYVRDLRTINAPVNVTHSSTLDEVNPAIDWPWLVCQVRSVGSQTAPWQVYAYNLANSQSFVAAPSSQDQLDPDVQAGRVVWQDFRDLGQGEIYLRNLELGGVRRITTNSFGQYHPAIYDNWIVWSDNRNTNLDIYGFDLLRNREIQITSTPEDENLPFLNGPWVICKENSLGAQTANPRLIHLPSLVAVPVTRTPTLKDVPSLGDGWALWQETVSGQTRIIAAQLPALQPVFQNRNTVAVTDAMVAYAHDAYGLLNLWGTNGVTEITAYTSLVPQVVSQTVTWSNGVPSGPNFNLVSGSFLWMRFDSRRVLDLGGNNNAALNLAAGANVFGYTRFPDAYSAYQLLRQLGLNNSPSVRMLDAESGRWLVAETQNGALVGEDFPIPNVAVLMVNLLDPVSQFMPQ